MPPEASQAVADSVRDLGDAPEDLEYVFERDDVPPSTTPAPARVPNFAEFLVDSGLLFEINRRVLHPLGLALETTVDDDGHTEITGILDYRSDPEGVLFADDTFNEGLRKLTAYMNARGTRAVVARRACVGFKVQGDPDV